MKKENDLIDSLLREHARNNGEDEKFLKKLEERLDAEEQDNVISMEDVEKTSVRSKRSYRPFMASGIAVAACAVIYFSGSSIWNSGSKSSSLAQQSDVANEQIRKTVLKYLEELEESSAFDDKGPELAQTAKLSNEQNQEFKEDSGFLGKSKENLKNTTDGFEHHPQKEIFLQKINNNSLRNEIKPAWNKPKIRGAKKTNFIKQLTNSLGETFSSKSKNSSEDQLKSKRFRNITLDGNNRGWKRRLTNKEREKLQSRHKALARSFSNEFTKPHDVGDGGTFGENFKYQGKRIESAFKSPSESANASSAFAIDVDTTFYANMRRMINSGIKVPVDSVRIEEMINYFDYQYKTPEQGSADPFAVYVNLAVCPWNEKNRLVRIALQGKEMILKKKPSSNIVFVLNVSDSRKEADTLSLLKQSLISTLEGMHEKDKISIVVNTSASGVVLPATKVDGAGKVSIAKTLNNLSVGGPSAGVTGIKLAYKLAKENFVKGGVNRVIVATDGNFSLDASKVDELVGMVKDKAERGVNISVLEFGADNLNEEVLKMVTNNGNGNYSYIDTIKEGKKVLLEEMTETLVAIAKDVKIEVDFNPEKVKQYRLIGYSNRIRANEKALANGMFLDKNTNAGKVAAGHRLTALYEIIPGKAINPKPKHGYRYKKMAKVTEKSFSEDVNENELLYVKLAYKKPDSTVNSESKYLAMPLLDKVKAWDEVDNDFKFTSSVALFGMVLRDSKYIGKGDLDLALQLAKEGKGNDDKGHRKEFIELLKKVKEKKKQ